MVHNSKSQENTVTYGQMNLIIQSRNLWREFVVWSRVYLISRIAGIGITDDVFNRLYRIPVEFGNVIRLIFGDQAANTIIQQSSTIVIFRDLVEAMVTGDTNMANEKVVELYKNGDERAAALSLINPFWDETFRQRIRREGSITTNQTAEMNERQLGRI
jgi:hypothetical protein